MLHTASRLEDCRRLSCADFIARYPQPVLVAIEILAGILKHADRSERPEPKPTRATFKTRARSISRGTTWTRPTRQSSALRAKMPELRQETMERDSGVPMDAPGVDPEMMRDRPIARPYFVELRKTMHEALGKVIIGRVQPCDVVINDFTISKRHAAFSYDQQHGVFVLTDMGSTNGTKVEGVHLTPQQSVVVQSYALIEFGRIKMRFLTPPHFYNWLIARGQ